MDYIQLEKEKKLNNLALELYAEHRAFRPMFPWVFVRVLPKEMRTASGLVLPDTDANKTVYEGIVLSTWSPYTKEVGHEYEAVSTFATRINRLAKKLYSHQVEQTEPIKVTRTIQMRSELTPGQHVLFPHWAGLPVVGYSDKHYRIVKEESSQSQNEGEIVATVDYDEANTKPRQQVIEMLSEALYESGMLDDEVGRSEFAAMFLAKMEQRFLLVDHDMNSLTLSGR